MTFIVAFADEHAKGVAAVCRELGWPTYSDPDVARRGCAAPGVTTTVAMHRASVDDAATVIGFAQVFGDGIVQGFLAQLGVLPAHRRTGVAAALVEAAFEASGVKRIDLVTDDAELFYETFPNKPKTGYRIYPKEARRSPHPQVE